MAHNSEEKEEGIGPFDYPLKQCMAPVKIFKRVKIGAYRRILSLTPDRP
jgi:hypothetical protein